MPKNIIAVDADDTILDENTAARLYMNDTYGYEHTEEDYLVAGPFETYFEAIWQLSPAETVAKYKEFAVSIYKENLKPIKDAFKVLQVLRQSYELVIVTSRGRGQRTKEMTYASLAKYYPDIFSEVYFTPLWKDGERVTKAELCKEIGASYLIDDAFENCEFAVEIGLQAILFGDYGWNREQALPAGMTRCKNWKEVEGHFVRLQESTHR